MVPARFSNSRCHGTYSYGYRQFTLLFLFCQVIKQLGTTPSKAPAKRVSWAGTGARQDALVLPACRFPRVVLGAALPVAITPPSALPDTAACHSRCLYPWASARA